MKNNRKNRKRLKMLTRKIMGQLQGMQVLKGRTISEQTLEDAANIARASIPTPGYRTINAPIQAMNVAEVFMDHLNHKMAISFDLHLNDGLSKYIKDKGLELAGPNTVSERFKLPPNVLEGFALGRSGIKVKEEPRFCSRCKKKGIELWMGFCLGCWRSLGKCVRCFPGKGDGNHAAYDHKYPRV